MTAYLPTPSQFLQDVATFRRSPAGEVLFRTAPAQTLETLLETLARVEASSPEGFDSAEPGHEFVRKALAWAATARQEPDMRVPLRQFIDLARDVLRNDSQTRPLTPPGASPTFASLAVTK